MSGAWCAYRMAVALDAAATADAIDCAARWIDPEQPDELSARDRDGGAIDLDERGTCTVAWDDGGGWKATWVQEHADAPAVTIEVRLAVTPDRARVRVGCEITLRCEHAVRPPFFPPAFAGRLLSAHAGLGEPRPLTADPWKVAAGAVGELVALVESDGRRRPVVVCSPPARPDRPAFDTARLARESAGLAHVAALADGDAVDRLIDRLGRDLAVWGGAARVYWPDLHHTVDHPLLTPRQGRGDGRRARAELVRLLAEASAVGTPPVG